MAHLRMKIAIMKTRLDDMRHFETELKQIEGTEKVRRLLAEAAEELKSVIHSYEDEYEEKGS